MELINVAWHVGAVVFGGWLVWLCVNCTHDRNVLHEALLPLLLGPADSGSRPGHQSRSHSRSQFVRSVRYLTERVASPEIRRHLVVDLGSIGVLKNHGTRRHEIQLLQQLYALISSDAPRGEKTLPQGGRSRPLVLRIAVEEAPQAEGGEAHTEASFRVYWELVDQQSTSRESQT